MCATLLVAGCGVVPEPTVEWDNGELSFDYPASWTDWGPDEPISLRRPTLLAYVGNTPVNTEEICAGTFRGKARQKGSAVERRSADARRASVKRPPTATA